MRLTQLDLSAYGHFSNARLTLPAPADGAPDLHIVYGPNEAGKSTLLSAWLDLLFGFPNVTKFAFLHDMRALRVQAQLRDTTGRVHALARIKGNLNTLLDATTDQPLPESVMAGLLGGVDRAAYGTMFSLDGKTLVDGAKSIMASEGELGQLLFQGTAGLAELGTRHRALEAQVEDWFSPRKRKTALAAHKKRLDELTAARKDADLTLGAWQKLTEAVAQAEALHTQTEHDHRDLLSRHQAVQRDLDARPILDRLRQATAQLAALPALRDIPADWRARLPDWQAEEGALAALTPKAEQALEQAQTALAQIQVDPAAVPFLPQIDTLEQRFGAVTKEMDDRPKRESELATLSEQMRAIAAGLGKRGVDPETLILPAPLIASLTNHMTVAAALSSQRATAEAEVTRAQDALSSAQAAVPDGADDMSALGPLADLLDQIRLADPLRTLADADADLRKATAALEGALGVLAPWDGDAGALTRIDLPSPATLRALQSDLTTRQDDLRAALVVQQQLDQVVARGRAGLGDADLPDASDVAASRTARDAAWTAHKAALSPQTADAFEVAMRADDMQQADMLNAARQFERADALRANLAELGTATAVVAAAQAAVGAVQDQVAGFWASVAPDSTSRPIADLIDWHTRRDLALKARALRDQALAARDAALAALQDWDTALATLVPLDGAGGFAARLADAQARLAKAKDTQQARLALVAAEADLRKRTTARDSVLAMQSDWQDKWRGLLTQAGWGADPLPDVVQMRAILGALAELPRLSAQATELRHRIDRITQDTDSFAAVIGQMAHALGQAPDPDPRLLWPRCRDQLRRARDAADTHARLVQNVAAARVDLGALIARKSALGAATADLCAAFPGQSLSQIGETFGHLRDAAEVHRQTEGLRATLSTLLDTDDLAEQGERLDALDPFAQSAEATALKAALDAQQKALQATYAEVVAARRARDSVSHDARAAQLDEDRATLLLEVEAEANAYLSRQAALWAVEAALHSYRDTHRSSMMDRAGAAFQVLTLGKYGGLGTRPDGAKELLIAHEQGGASKGVDTLSTGAADQLYLALRIAGYQELADQRPMVPFIADDILESFDDDRAGAAFGLLAQMAQRGQVIYLTHHAHLCTIARAACPSVQVHDLHRL